MFIQAGVSVPRPLVLCSALDGETGVPLSCFIIGASEGFREYFCPMP